MQTVRGHWVNSWPDPCFDSRGRYIFDSLRSGRSQQILRGALGSQTQAGERVRFRAATRPRSLAGLHMRPDTFPKTQTDLRRIQAEVARVGHAVLSSLGCSRSASRTQSPQSTRQFALATEYVLTFVLSEVASASSWSRSIKGLYRLFVHTSAVKRPPVVD